MDDNFELLWKLGPWLRLGKKAAARHFKATVKTEQDWVDIQAAREIYIDHLRANSWKHPQHGSTWMHTWRQWLTQFDYHESYHTGTPYFAIEGSKRGAPLTEREQEGAKELIALRAKRGGC